MRKQDIEVGQFYLSKARYGQPSAYLVLTLDPMVYVQTPLLFARSTKVGHRTTRATPGHPRFVALEVISPELGAAMDAWADGGDAPQIVHDRHDIVEKFVTWVNVNLANPGDLADIPDDLFPGGTRPLMFTTRELVGAWAETRASQLTERREKERRDAEAKRAAAQRANEFDDMAALAKSLDVPVFQSREYFRAGHLSHKYVLIDTADMMALLKEVEAARD